MGWIRRRDQDRSLDGIRIGYGSAQEAEEAVHERHKPLTQRHWEY